MSSPLTAASSADSLAVSISQLSTGDGTARGSKKNQVSLTHLLNLSFPAREEPQNTGPVRRRRNVNQPFDKDKFINAKYVPWRLTDSMQLSIVCMNAGARSTMLRCNG